MRRLLFSPRPRSGRGAGGEGLRAVALCLLLLARPAHADPLAQLHEFLSGTTSARGDFSQSVVKGNAAGANKNSSGQFEFARPGRFRWVYDKPYPETIVSDGQKLYVYDQDLNQVTVKRLQGAIPASPASILFGSNDFERDFEVQADGQHNGVEWIRAIPRAQDSTFNRIRIGFQGGVPVAMELTDSFGQVTELQLNHFQRNPHLDAAQFHFEPPRGADVLQEP